MAGFNFPGGKRFAFTILDDTDVATVANVRPLYRLLERLGLRTTKTVWPVSCPEGSGPFHGSETLEDADYRAFVLDLEARGFEVTWHGATMGSSRRERTLAAFERFCDVFGHPPTVHANHSFNRENLYWGVDRVDNPLLAAVFRRTSGVPADYFQGHRPGSPYWWGDLSAQHISYARNLTFNELNTARLNPSMPYRDPRRPLVRWWFSASDAEDCAAFNALLQSPNQARLEEEGGVAIVATHLGKGFVRDGEVDATTRRLLEELAGRPGWFPPVRELLDWLRLQRETDALPAAEWSRMQLRWGADLLRRKSFDSLRRMRRERAGRVASLRSGRR